MKTRRFEQIVYFTGFNYRLKLGEGFLAGLALGDLQGVELHGLAERSAFSDSDGVSNLGVPEAGGEMHGHVLVSLLEPVVLLHVVQVITPETDKI